MILLDTHAVVWLLLAPEQLSSRARDAILQARTDREKLACSQLSIYEIAHAAHRKLLPLNSTAAAFIAALEDRLEILPLTTEIEIRAAELPDSLGGDPMDRILVATAIVHSCPLICRDDRIRRASLCNVVW